MWTRYDKTFKRRTEIVMIEAEELHARAAVAVLGAVHLLLALSFVLVLLMTANRAFAQEACGGQNLIEAMRESDPDRLAELEAEAADTPNGEGLLWRIESGDGAPSWLYGTMHVSDPRVLEMSQAASEAFDDADTVAIETDEIVDPETAQAAILMRPELTMFTDGTTLQSLMSAEDYALVEEALKERGLPVAAVSRMKPWMIAGLVALPDCEMARKSSGEAFLDRRIAERAIEKGKELEGLETVEEQLSAMAALPMEFHIEGLVETLSLGPLLDDIMATMTDLYVDGRIGMIMPMIRQAAPPGSGIDAEGYAAFEQRIVLDRNRLMAKRAAPLLAEGDVFIAVGALHLPGEEGLIELFREQGYTVTRAQ